MKEKIEMKALIRKLKDMIYYLENKDENLCLLDIEN
jgi:hypothetical protein